MNNIIFVEKPEDFDLIPNNTKVKIICKRCKKTHIFIYYTTKKRKQSAKMMLCKSCKHSVLDSLHPEWHESSVMSRLNSPEEKKHKTKEKMHETWEKRTKQEKQDIVDKRKATLNEKDPNWREKHSQKIHKKWEKRTREEKQSIVNKRQNTLKKKLGKNWSSIIGKNISKGLSKLTKEDHINILKEAEKTFKNNHNGMTYSEYEQTEGYRDECIRRNQELYNKDWYAQTNDHKIKAKNTCQKKFNNDTYLGSDAYKQLMIDNFGSIRANFKYLYYGISFDSKYELAVWIYCKDHNIGIIREPIKLPYVDAKGINHVYIPDFYIDGVGLIEIKGNQFFNSDGTMKFPYTKPHHDSEPYTEEQLNYLNDLYERKRLCAINNGVKILREKNIKFYLQYCKIKYNLTHFEKLFSISNKQNITLKCPNGFIQYNFKNIYNRYYYTYDLINNITPYNVSKDNDGYVEIQGQGITPFDIGKFK